MSSNSLWNPFMFSVFRDPRTFKNDDDGGGGNDNDNDNDNQPSSAPAPTVFYNDYSDPSNPVLDTMSAVADRRSGDGSTSSSYALANDTNFTDTNAPAATFGDTFSANRAAGNATFTHNGNLYTTDLAPEAPTGIAALRPVSRPTNLLSSNEKALVDEYNAVPDSNENYTPSSATMAAVLKSQDKTSAVTAPLTTSEQVAQYGGVDLDARDAATTASNNASAATAFDNSDFDYTVLDKGQGGIGPGSPLPDNNVVADLSGFANYNPQDFLNEAGSGVQLEKSYDAFGNEYNTKTGAALADIAAEKARNGAACKCGFRDWKRP